MRELNAFQKTCESKRGEELSRFGVELRERSIEGTKETFLSGKLLDSTIWIYLDGAENQAEGLEMQFEKPDYRDGSSLIHDFIRVVKEMVGGKSSRASAVSGFRALPPRQNTSNCRGSSSRAERGSEEFGRKVGSVAPYNGMQLWVDEEAAESIQIPKRLKHRAPKFVLEIHFPFGAISEFDPDGVLPYVTSVNNSRNHGLLQRGNVIQWFSLFGKFPILKKLVSVKLEPFKDMRQSTFGELA